MFSSISEHAIVIRIPTSILYLYIVPMLWVLIKRFLISTKFYSSIFQCLKSVVNLINEVFGKRDGLFNLEKNVS